MKSCAYCRDIDSPIWLIQTFTTNPIAKRFEMKISSIHAHPISFPVPEDKSVRLGIGRSVKRDAVLLRVQTDEGITGGGEAHHGRCPGAIARLIDTTL